MKIYKYKGKKHPEITRKSYRDYTHVVILYAGGKLINKSFCGRPDMVDARISQLRSWHEELLVTRNGYKPSEIEYVVDELERE
jgi:hypothetical protein